jgi:hypothetical protein
MTRARWTVALFLIGAGIKAAAALIAHLTYLPNPYVWEFLTFDNKHILLLAVALAKGGDLYSSFPGQACLVVSFGVECAVVAFVVSTCARRYRRQGAHGLVAPGVLILVGPLAAAETCIVLRHGHPGIGLHTDIVSRTEDSSVAWSLRGANFTPIPLPIRVCVQHDSSRGAVFRSGIEIWTNDNPRWRLAEENPDTCRLLGDLEWRVLWPGASVDLGRIGPDQFGATSTFRNGGRFRYVVYTAYDKPDDGWLQFRFVSPERVVGSAPAAR